MSTPIVECIANYSEARRPEVMEEIIRALQSVQGVTLLDRHSDLDHNRTVLSFVGAPGVIEEAAFRSIAKAAELINLDDHKGEHPRIGATDVVPFVPITEVSMQDCVQIARRLGERVGDELNIPVYLYEEAATRPERKNLEDIRRGEYETLKLEIATNPLRSPDFGPARLGTAGATVIGARQPLIAYNVYLTSGDVSIAEKIAKAIRHSSGGLRYLKARGMLVAGLAQVSMNMTNHRQTPLARVVELIRREATRYGVAIHHSELVGLIPQDALIDAAVWYLQLDQFEPDQVLEKKLFAPPQKNRTQAQVRSEDFLTALASGEPTPGGGSAAAYSAAAGAALVAMVARLTIGKKKYMAVEAEMQAILAQAEELRAALTRSVEEDAEAFEGVMQAFRLPKDTPEQIQTRNLAIEKATLGALGVPWEVAQKAELVLSLAVRVADQGNINALCDAGTGAAMARAALTGAALNIRTNANALQNHAAAENVLTELSALEARCTALDNDMRVILRDRGGLVI